MNITYKTIKVGLKSSIAVYNGRKNVGHIRKDGDGFAYFPKGSATLKGDTMPTVNAVMRSLESE